MNLQVLSATLIAALTFSVYLPASAKSKEPDLLVIGGTPAGIAAAIAAARLGEHVELISRRPVLGGILVDAMMDQWDLNLARDGQSVEGGIFTEIHRDLGDSFTPGQAASVFARMVDAEPLIHVVYNAVPIAVHTSVASNLHQITTIEFQNTENRSTFVTEAPYVVDATDDGDVAALAGARYDLGRQDTGRDDRMQAVTLMFSLTGVNWQKIEESYDTLRYGPGGTADRRAWGYSKLLSAYHSNQDQVSVADLNLGHENGGNVTVNAIDVLGIDGCNPSDIARARANTEQEAPRVIAWLRTHLPGFEHAAINRYADYVYVRETRHFAGLERLTASDVWGSDIPTDTIGLSSYPMDLHPVVLDEKQAYAPIRHVYGIPFGSLVPVDFSNLVLASPAISASHIASGSARVIPTTIEEGEAAGTAAAIANKRHITFPALARSHTDISVLRADLTHYGVVLTQTGVAIGQN